MIPASWREDRWMLAVAFGWSPAEIDAIRVDEMAYWHAVARARVGR